MNATRGLIWILLTASIGAIFGNLPSVWTLAAASLAQYFLLDVRHDSVLRVVSATLAGAIVGGWAGGFVTMIGSMGFHWVWPWPALAGGAVAGAVLGVGQALALLGGGGVARGLSWMMALAGAWSLGQAAGDAWSRFVDPHGQELWSRLANSGWSESMAARAVSARSGVTCGVVAGTVTLLAVLWLRPVNYPEPSGNP
jgi:hypothetical protein